MTIEQLIAILYFLPVVLSIIAAVYSVKSGKEEDLHTLIVVSVVPIFNLIIIKNALSHLVVTNKSYKDIV